MSVSDQGQPSDAATTRRSRLGIRRAQAHLRHRFYGLTFLSTLIPGAGLTRTRMRRLGWLLVGVAVLSAVAIAIAALKTGITQFVLSLAVRPGLLHWLMAVVIGGALVWIAAILLTAGQTRPADHRGRVLRPLFAMLCCLAVAAPSAKAAQYLYIQADTIQSVFAGQPGVTNTPIATAAVDPWKNKPRVNVLVIGSDAGSGRDQLRTDSMIVASIDTKTGDTVMFGIPRSLSRAPIAPDNPLYAIYPNGYYCPQRVGDPCWLNALWRDASDYHKQLFIDAGIADPGLYTLKQTLGIILGIQIDRTAIVDLSGFRQLVDAMGGVVVNVKARTCMFCKHGTDPRVIVFTKLPEQWIEPGVQRLNGEQALWYSRSRAQSDDNDRMKRQRCMAAALVSQVNPVSMLQSYPELMAVVRHHITVDIPQEELPAWVQLIEKVQKGRVRSLPITNSVTPSDNPEWAKILELVRSGLQPAPATANTPNTPAATGSTSSPAPSRSTLTPGAPSPSVSSSTSQQLQVEDVAATC